MIKNINYGIAAIVIILGVIACVMATLALVSSFYVQKGDSPNISEPVFAEDETKRETTGAWLYKCGVVNAGNEQCSLSQSVMSEDHKVILRARISIVKRQEQNVPRLTLITPLGTFLPLALRLHLPPQDAFSIPFQYCTQEGCIVNLDLADDVIMAMSRAPELYLSYTSEDRDKKNVTLTLNGIEQGIKRLETQ